MAFGSYRAAHFGLAMTYYGRRELDAFRAAAERALALTPNHSIVVAAQRGD